MQAPGFAASPRVLLRGRRSFPVSAMFSSVPRLTSAAAAPLAAAPFDSLEMRDDARSRSPPPDKRGVGADQTGGATVPFPVAGVAQTERWLNENVTEPEIIANFMELQQWRRKTVILKCIEERPDNVHSWLFACIRNFRNSELEKRVLGTASVHHTRPPSSATMSMPLGAASPMDQRQQEAASCGAASAPPVLPLNASGLSG